MESQYWTIAQMAVDLVIACILLWFIRLNLKTKRPGADHDEALRRSEGILAEMRELTLTLDRNLEEKQRQSSMILEELEDAIGRAEEAYDRIRDAGKDLVANPDRSKGGPRNSEHVSASVRALIAKGLAREEIAQHLGMSVDEIDLLIKVQSRSGQGKKKSIHDERLFGSKT